MSFFLQQWPFFILLDDQLTIISAGPSVTERLPSVVPGACFSDLFVIERPEAARAATYQAILEHRDVSYKVASIEKLADGCSLTLRGISVSYTPPSSSIPLSHPPSISCSLRLFPPPPISLFLALFLFPSPSPHAMFVLYPSLTATCIFPSLPLFPPLSFAPSLSCSPSHAFSPLSRILPSSLLPSFRPSLLSFPGAMQCLNKSKP